MFNVENWQHPNLVKNQILSHLLSETTRYSKSKVSVCLCERLGDWDPCSNFGNVMYQLISNVSSSQLISAFDVEN
jgi:hypothetical protein